MSHFQAHNCSMFGVVRQYDFFMAAVICVCSFIWLFYSDHLLYEGRCNVLQIFSSNNFNTLRQIFGNASATILYCSLHFVDSSRVYGTTRIHLFEKNKKQTLNFTKVPLHRKIELRKSSSFKFYSWHQNTYNYRTHQFFLCKMHESIRYVRRLLIKLFL